MLRVIEARHRRLQIMIPFIHGSGKCKLIYSDRRQVSGYGCLGAGSGKKNCLQRGMGKLLGVMEIFHILIVVMILLMYSYFKITKLYAFNGYSLLYINYASMVNFLKITEERC